MSAFTSRSLLTRSRQTSSVSPGGTKYSISVRTPLREAPMTYRKDLDDTRTSRVDARRLPGRRPVVTVLVVAKIHVTPAHVKGRIVVAVPSESTQTWITVENEQPPAVFEINPK